MVVTNATHQYADSARPNPLGQSFWLVITMAAVILVVTAMGQSLTEAGAENQRFDGDDLIELAAPTKSAPMAAELGRTGPTDAPPALIGAPRLSRDAKAGPGAEDTLDGDPAAKTRPFEELVGAEARGLAALDTISYPWAQILPEWSIDFMEERDGFYGLTLVPEKRIEIYVRESQTRELLAHVIAHELGHAIDVTLNDGPDRRRWEDARSTGGSPWWPGNGTTDFSTGAGDFAESFAAWQVGTDSYRSTLAPPPTEEQVRLLAQLAAG